MEYVFQHVNKYKDASIETWQEFYTTVENMQDSEMQIHLIEFTDTSQYMLERMKRFLVNYLGKSLFQNLQMSNL